MNKIIQSLAVIFIVVLSAIIFSLVSELKQSNESLEKYRDINRDCNIEYIDCLDELSSKEELLMAYEDLYNWSNKQLKGCIGSLKEERASENYVAKNYFKNSQIWFEDGKVVVKEVDDVLTELVFQDTLSMNPVLNHKTTALAITPEKESDLEKNNIIVFENSDGKMVVHRIIKVSKDSGGFYYETKGDNNPIPDFGKVRFEKVKYKIVALFY